MAFAWAITSENKLRSTWGDASVQEPIPAATGYPGANIIDGNKESKWVAEASGTKVIEIDSGDDSLDIDYLCLWFDYGVTLPSALKVETSDNAASYTSIANQYDGTVTTSLSASLDGTSRIVPVNDVTGFAAGNTVKIVSTYEEHYIVVTAVSYTHLTLPTN